MEITLEMAIEWHLIGNHYPPVPKSMIKPCIEAIMSYNEGDHTKLIELPEGITYQNGKTSAPAVALINAHHLDDWLVEEDEWI